MNALADCFASGVGVQVDVQQAKVLRERALVAGYGELRMM